MKAPFPWFGGKRRVAHLVWERFGDVRHYVEPFAGSLAVLLGRPHPPRVETVNDLDPYLANFWRAVRADPHGVAEHADWPISEADLHARHQWLVEQADFRESILADPHYYDVLVAGWWVWGLSVWIGGEWCSERWWHDASPARQKPKLSGNGAQGVVAQSLPRKRPQLGSQRGVTRVHLKRPELHRARGVQTWKRKPSLQGGQKGVVRFGGGVTQQMQQICQRLRGVRVCCGSWERVCTPAVIYTDSPRRSGIFLDPPYSSESGRSARQLYGCDSTSLARDVAQWARSMGDDPRLRIGLCGLEGEHEMPGWTEMPWTRPPGYGNVGDGVGATNARREVVWFSPHCRPPSRQATLWDLEGVGG